VGAREPRADAGDHFGLQAGPGLFQVEAIPDGHLDSFAATHAPFSLFGISSPGYPIFQHWGRDSLASNYFNVNFLHEVKCTGANGGPCVHATVSVSGGKLWPMPTPKFQTRLHP